MQKCHDHLLDYLPPYHLLKYFQKEVTQKQTTNIPKISTEKKVLLKLIQQWLEEYVESQITLFVQQCYQQLTVSQQATLKNDYYEQQVLQNPLIYQLLLSLQETIENHLKIKLPKIPIIEQNLTLIVEKCLAQNFNKVH